MTPLSLTLLIRLNLFMKYTKEKPNPIRPSIALSNCFRVPFEGIAIRSYEAIKKSWTRGWPQKATTTSSARKMGKNIF